MDEALPVDLTERRRQTNGNAQEAGQIERLSLASLNNPIQRFTAWVLENEESCALRDESAPAAGLPMPHRVRLLANIRVRAAGDSEATDTLPS